VKVSDFSPAVINRWLGWGKTDLTYKATSSALSKSHQKFMVFNSMFFKLTIDSHAATSFRLTTRLLTRRLFCAVPFDNNQLTKNIMKTAILALTLVSSLALFSQAAEAKGCLKGAAVGGVGGHLAGGHGLLGAGAGCLVGRHMANKKAKQEAAGNAEAPAKK